MEECPICIEKYDNNVFMCKAENDKKEMLMNSEFEPIDIDKYKSK